MEMLREVPFSDLTNWSVRYLLYFSFNYNQSHNLKPIGNFLIKNRDVTFIQDDIKYKRITVKMNGNGVTLRDVIEGNNIGTKKQFRVKEGQFIISKIDARNGAMGLIPNELNDAIVTNDFPTFSIDDKKINAIFLLLITTTKTFVKFAQSCSSGTTNRQRININQFLDIKIPLPPLLEQNRIVANYNSKIQQSKEQEEKSRKLEQGIENYLFEVLGIEKLEEKENVTGLQFAHLKNIDRWDILAKDLRIINGLENGKYKLKKIGEVFNFPSRSWNKKEYKESTFKYIELGAIDPITGITELKEIEVEKAPSRATQQIEVGDFLIGTTRPYLKKFVIINSKFNDNICSSGFSIIASSPDYNLFYLKEFLMSYFGLEQLKNRMTGGTYPAITNNELKELLVPFPKIEIQNKIANHILSLKQQIKDLQNQAKENRRLAIQEFEKEIFR